METNDRLATMLKRIEFFKGEGCEPYLSKLVNNKDNTIAGYVISLNLTDVVTLNNVFRDQEEYLNIEPTSKPEIRLEMVGEI